MHVDSGVMAADAAFSLDPQFWDRFVADHWNRRPGVFRDVLREPVLSDRELMLGLRRRASALASQLAYGNDERWGVDMRYYVGHRMVLPPEYARFAPTGDRLEDYLRDAGAGLAPSEPLGIFAQHFHLAFPPLWPRLRALVDPLVERVGIPASGLESAVFCGAYCQSPFGIHRDIGNAVLTFGVVGRKRMLLWPPEYFRDRPDALFAHPNAKLYANDAVELEIGPRDMLYWPADWYHTGHNVDRAPHATLSVGLWHRARLADHVGRAAAAAISRELGSNASFQGSWRAGDDLPPELRAAVAAVERIAGSGALSAAITARWRDRVGRGGFDRAPDDDDDDDDGGADDGP
jgi:hypothetical protein